MIQHLQRSRLLLAACLLVAAVLCVIAIAAQSPSEGQAPLPFIRWDVAVIHLLTTLPLAWLLANSAICRTRPVAITLAACVLGLSMLPAVDVFDKAIRNMVISFPFAGLLLRTAMTLGLLLPAVLACRWAGADSAGARSTGASHQPMIGSLALAALLAFVLPWTYTTARCQHDVGKLGELLQQSRFGEARKVAHTLVLLDARRTWNGYPLPQVAADIDRAIEQLTSRAAIPLTISATADQRLERAAELAMLGRNSAAIETIETLPQPLEHPRASNLLATIYETEGSWSAALEAYRQASTLWRLQPASSEQAAGLLQAITGIAYCQRKQGRYGDAEATYQQVLGLSPSGHSHFLLAQFYEDTQQAEKAHAHARRAMELSPQQYQQRGQKLIDKLSIYHFGCWGVYNARKSDRSSATSGSANE